MGKKILFARSGVAAVMAAMLCASCACLPWPGARAGAIRIGAVSPLGGYASAYGIATRNGCEMAVAEWNAKGGVLGRPIMPIFADERFDEGSAGSEAFGRLISTDKVAAIVGGFGSPASLAGAAICQRMGIPMVTPSAPAVGVTEAGDCVFRVCMTDRYQGTLAARFAFTVLGARRAALLFSSGEEYAVSLARNFSDEFFEAQGGEIVAAVGHPNYMDDFTEALEELLRSEPDLIFCSDFPRTAAIIIRQARELGYQGPIVGSEPWYFLPGIMGEDAGLLENCFFPANNASDAPDPESREFAARYAARYGYPPDSIALLGYEAMSVMLDAIRRAGSTDGADIKEALASTDIRLPSGRLRFDDSRNPIKPGTVMVIKDGTPAFYATVDP